MYSMGDLLRVVARSIVKASRNDCTAKAHLSGSLQRSNEHPAREHLCLTGTGSELMPWTLCSLAVAINFVSDGHIPTSKIILSIKAFRNLGQPLAVRGPGWPPTGVCVELHS